MDSFKRDTGKDTNAGAAEGIEHIGGCAPLEIGLDSVSFQVQRITRVEGLIALTDDGLVDSVVDVKDVVVFTSGFVDIVIKVSDGYDRVATGVGERAIEVRHDGLTGSQRRDNG